MTPPRAATLALLLVAAPAAALSLSGGKAAWGQVPCATRDTVAKALTEGFGEVPVAIGVTPSGNVMELYASANRTWTIVVTTPGGGVVRGALRRGLRAGSGPAGQGGMTWPTRSS